MKLSVLHISDLHRDPANPISNQVLLDSLKRDRDRYTSSENGVRVRSPDLMVVTGDIVQGLRYDASGAKTTLQKQYDEALDFLNSLTEEFVAGDKRRVILVPGNHDVSDYCFRQSLEEVDIAAGVKKELVEHLFEQNSQLRWSWRKFALYKIVDANMYANRFEPFSDFYSKFYDGQRCYSTEPAKQFDTFNLKDWGVTVVGFSSCYNNDPLNKQGSIYPDCIAAVRNQLRDFSHEGHLRIAVWHHNIEGPPLKVDYMDPSIAQNLIDGGFSLGFHGHQHKPQFLDTRFQFGSNRRITVISAGTLCGSAAFRFGRAYNLIELDTGLRIGRLHVREMQNENLQLPIWGPRPLPFCPIGAMNFSFDPPPEPMVGADRNTTALRNAQQLYHGGDYREAVQILTPLTVSEKLARPFLLKCLLHLDDTQGIVTAFDPPEGAAEAIALMDSLWDQNKRRRLGEVLELPEVSGSSDPSIIEMRRKYSARLMR